VGLASTEFVEFLDRGGGGRVEKPGSCHSLEKAEPRASKRPRLDDDAAMGSSPTDLRPPVHQEWRQTLSLEHTDPQPLPGQTLCCTWKDGMVKQRVSLDLWLPMSANIVAAAAHFTREVTTCLPPDHHLPIITRSTTKDTSLHRRSTSGIA